MGKFPSGHASDKLRERLAYIETMKQQMLDLEAVRQKLAQAERALGSAMSRNRRAARGRLEVIRLRASGNHIGPAETYPKK